MLTKKIKIDNAGLIYPCSATKTFQSIHSISAYFKDELDIEMLQKALEKVIKRFPTFQVKLKKGFFWNYFETTDEIPVVQQNEKQCELFDLKNGLLFRIVCFKKRLSIETFHAIADGYGSLVFFNTLIATYLNLKGENILPGGLVLDITKKAKPSEIDDDFVNVFEKHGKRKGMKEDSGYQIKGEKANCLTKTSIDIDLKLLKQKAAEKDCNLNEYLLAVYFESLLQEKNINDASDKKPVKISVPVNLRRMYGNTSLRNFSSYLNYRIPSQKTYDFDEIIKIIKEQSKLSTKEYYQTNINGNVALQNSFFVNYLPRCIKDKIVGTCYGTWGELLYTTILSNMGKIASPVEFEKYIDKYECLVGANKFNAKCMCCVGYKNILNIVITGSIKQMTLDELFVKNLKKYNLL